VRHSTARNAIVGVGATAQGELPGKSADTIATMAVVAALEDAGIDKAEVDGLITCKPPGAAPGTAGTDESMAAHLGINPRFSSTLEYGACGFSLHFASSVISAGLADTVLLTFGTNARSVRTSYAVNVASAEELTAPYGFVHVAGPAAMAFRRHQALYGTTEEQLGWVAVSQREWAGLNDRAVFRKPMTIDDYLSSPYLVEPLRRHDLTMISDGGVAIVVTRADRANDFAKPPVRIAGIAQASGMRNDQNPDKLLRPWLTDLSEQIYSRSGFTASDIDVAYLQDATSVWVLQQLEAYGFCGIGEGGAFLAEGHTRPGGSLPVNTGGGQLSEAYSWNWLNLVEAVCQLRGTCGERQVSGARVALHAQTHDFWKGAATILTGPDL